MSTIDDTSTPMKMMTEENELQKKQLQQQVATSSPETAPTAEPSSPSSFLMTPVASPMKVHSSNPGLSPLSALIDTDDNMAAGGHKVSVKYSQQMDMNPRVNLVLRLPLILLLLTIPAFDSFVFVLLSNNGTPPIMNTITHQKWHKTVPIETDSTRPTKSLLAQIEASRAIQDRLRQHQQHQPSRMDFSTTACPYLESTQTLQTPNGQFSIYGDHQSP
ncbi:unnamed protein product [Cylindrotheca closterium]|uniref:Uncharacterized protein n=1 Tax=Cylindrotheca closterium TaxID=2856 RepID=A0AAD2FVD3_9STRA|nr:unnamed protein product [Cylindrotheca closterium]